LYINWTHNGEIVSVHEHVSSQKVHDRFRLNLVPEVDSKSCWVNLILVCTGVL
jgi:hypothetical protein